MKIETLPQSEILVEFLSHLLHSKWSQQTIQHYFEIDTRSYEQTNVTPRSTHDLHWADHDALAIDTRPLAELGKLWYYLLHPLEESNDTPIVKISIPMPSKSRTNYHEHKYKEKKREQMILMRFGNLPTS